jgi:hypothetical protein
MFLSIYVNLLDVTPTFLQVYMCYEKCSSVLIVHTHTVFGLGMIKNFEIEEVKLFFWMN